MTTTLLPPSPAPVTGHALLARIRDGLIGDGVAIDTPYGRRPIVYVDHTASGRAVDFVEDLIRHRVLPYYANTHTESSYTGLSMGRLREQARELIHREVGATAEHAVVFCGSGSTTAIHKLATMVGAGTWTQRPVVFIGPYEHHSNELIWRESAADVVVIATDRDGRLNLADLRRQLECHHSRRRLIGSFSAASNVTGLLTDTDEVSSLLHAYGALACWDYASAGPYVPIRMAPSRPGASDYKDAVFLSTHKFVGGPQTPGVLVVNRRLVPEVPTVPGGGTIAFVSPHGQLYAPDPVAREEGGTPAIVESIRAGLAFAIKRDVGTDLIHERHQQMVRTVVERCRHRPGLELLGNPDLPRLPIFSFRIRHGARYLHHNYVVALLSDLFGIQARGGCSCAGPYGHRLLHIDAVESAALHAECAAGHLGIKPGWARVSFPYVATEDVVEYVLSALELVADHGHRLLGDYTFHPSSGLWRHRYAAAAPSLDDLLVAAPPQRLPVDGPALAGHLLEARRLLLQGPDLVEDAPTGLPASFEALRRFHLPPGCLRG